MDHHNNKRKRRPHKRGIWDPNYPISAKMRSRHDGLDVQSSDSDTDECVMLDAPASSTSENENINEIQYMKSLPNSPADQLDNVSDSEESGNQSDESESFDTSESTQGDSSEDETSSDEELAGDFANLEQLLFTNETSQATLGIALLKLCKIYSKHLCSKGLLRDVISLINEILPRNSNFPSSLHKFLEIASSVVPNCNYTSKYFCADCHKSFGDTDKDICERCSSKSSAVYVSNDLSALVKVFFESNGLAQTIDAYKTTQIADEKVRDIVDGRRFQSSNKNQYDLALIQNIKSIPVANGAETQIWPNALAICDISPDLRSKSVLLESIWYSNSKPDMIHYLSDFFDSFELLSIDGVDWKNPVTNNIENSKLFMIASTVDDQTRCEMQYISQSDGKYGCSFCEIPTSEWKHNMNSTKIYPFKLSGFPLRTQENMIEQANYALRNDPGSGDENVVHDYESNHFFQTKGVKGYTPLTLFDNFDIAKGFSPDYLHSCLVGVVRRNISTILDERNSKKEFQIVRYLGLINIKLDEITPPKFMKRPPRPLNKIMKWEGSEIRNWLLYYSLPIMKEFWPKQYLEHHLLLVFGIHTLLKEEVSKEEVESARRALEEYCGLYPLHYEAEDQTFDLHMLLHLPDSVLELGPLQMHSTDAFGNAKFRLGQDIHGSGARVAKKLQNTMQIINFQTCLQFKYEKDEAQKIQVLGGKVLTEKISREVIDFLENRVIVLEDDYTMEFYLRAKVNSVTFTSEFYTKEKTTDSSFVKYKKNDSQEEFARVMYFVTVNTDKVYFIGKKIDLMSPVFENNEMAVSVDHIRPYSVTNEIVMCSASKIVMPLIKVESFLCIPPNTFERSL
ncbi:uncharacterized protein LOC132200121 isoform X1 [Neocloeon triangulifer]|uniref:uncharacterized protein LOC132200121 isoform X1 n=1 Tax=Neocloeon triangulifer TaxID=2078957 RepID=UPI00286F46FB|nr:uncharacterized protein LOC132200121 isoform X1 [Neocloeon triangulifer]